MTGKRLKVMVSSTVYGNEELFELVYTILTQTGKYEVWMSHKGTMPVFSSQSAFENCLNAVEKCDAFLGFITPYYGSGKNEDRDNLSITHQELVKAIDLDKPRWILVHDHVVFARSLLKYLNYEKKEDRRILSLKQNKVLDDLRVIDMYEYAIRDIDEIPLMEKKGNWVQKYQSDDDALLFAISQFSRFQEVKEFVEKNCNNVDAIIEKITRKRGKS
ncbi:MAG TPA: DUF4062 domain-containing protein [Methanospirillum sp.]|uniref:DUF4062 domain-containing protein n=1 Tax=Methanospirillum sp. TaxID=45200 RepID=UPI002C7113FA|nr:DUF4062 domain-containing protein [Methanospirillum sp.]HPY60804.1 DUF4062 domain-containing protein [Methanospirillum sp.]